MTMSEAVSAMEKRVFIRRGTCSVWIEMIDGSVRLSGQDLGGFPGAGEYEYWITVQSSDFPRIREMLGAAPDADIEDLLCVNAGMIYSRGEMTWFESIGITPEFSNYF